MRKLAMTPPGEIETGANPPTENVHSDLEIRLVFTRELSSSQR